jgi:hypothetical protein
MQTLIVILIVAAAAFYIGRMFYRRFTQKEGCACGCSCCDASAGCNEPAATSDRETLPDQADH